MLRNKIKVYSRYYRSRNITTKFHSDRFGLVIVTAVLENIQSLHRSRSSEINLDRMAISSLGEPGTVIRFFRDRL